MNAPCRKVIFQYNVLKHLARQMRVRRLDEPAKTPGISEMARRRQRVHPEFSGEEPRTRGEMLKNASQRVIADLSRFPQFQGG
jgi:hypothetical protein